MDNFTRYLRLIHWARARYTTDGVLMLSVGGQPTTYSRIEATAWRKLIAGTHDLDQLTHELTAYTTFEELVTDRGRTDSTYRPTLRVALGKHFLTLADAYDAAQAERGSPLRAVRS